MKKDFAVTANVKRYLSAAEALISAPPGIDRYMLTYGHCGLGKTETNVFWKNTVRPDAVFIRIKKAMNVKWLLTELVEELGMPPAKSTMDLFKQAVGELIGTDRPVIFDEVDYVAGKTLLIQTLADIGDMSGAPILLIGMPSAPDAFARYEALSRRITQIVPFESLTVQDVRAVLDQICEVPIGDDAVEAIHKAPKGNKPCTCAQLYRWAQACEHIHKARKLDPGQAVNADMLQKR